MLRVLSEDQQLILPEFYAPVSCFTCVSVVWFYRFAFNVSDCLQPVLPDTKRYKFVCTGRNVGQKYKAGVYKNFRTHNQTRFISKKSAMRLCAAILMPQHPVDHKKHT